MIVFSLYVIYVGHSERCSTLKSYVFFVFVLWLWAVFFIRLLEKYEWYNMCKREIKFGFTSTIGFPFRCAV
jgi:hypothetical protein